MTKNSISSISAPPLPCIDRLLILEASGKAAAERVVNPDERFFVDHFPEFPVLPGVLQLNGMVQTASWWLQWKHDFKFSTVHMTECSPAKFSKLVRPGMKIQFDVQMLKSAEGVFSFKGQVSEGDQKVSQARFKLKFFSTGVLDGRFGGLEESINRKNREIFKSLTQQAQIR